MSDQQEFAPEPEPAPADPRPTRRTVLKAIGIGGGAVLLAGTGVVGVRSVRNGVWDVGEGDPWALWRGWQDVPGTAALAAAGVLAANPHNLQPWSWVVGDGVVDLHDDPARAMPLGDPDGRERVVGYGCAVQNVVVAARARGLAAQVRAWPDPADPTHVARIVLAPGPAPDEDAQRLADAIATRHSNRGPYRGDPVDPATLAVLAGEEDLGASVVWVTDPAARATLGALYVEATEAIVADEPMSVEAFSWFRDDRAQIERYRDGLTLDCQGLSPFMLAAAKILPAQSRAAGDAFWVKSTREVHTATAAAYGVVAVPDVRSARDRLAGGRLLQRVHLAAQAAGLGLQHMNQIGERIDRDRALGANDRFADRWSQVLGLPAGQALVSFRVGYPVRTANPSPRRALEAVGV